MSPGRRYVQDVIDFFEEVELQAAMMPDLERKLPRSPNALADHFLDVADKHDIDFTSEGDEP